MTNAISLSEFMERVDELVLIDARSEGEFAQGHFPGALNLPLLNNEERKIVGTTYKQEGREAAVKKGFELVGHKFAGYIESAQKLAPRKKLAMYCWRGGMRSTIMSWVLNLSGFEVTLLTGGYKIFRNWVLEKLKEERKLLVLGGKTCSGKTDILHMLSQKGEHVIDLEGMAHHKGSAFGALGQLPQPTNEHFENLLAMEWNKYTADSMIWIENESNRIGSVKIPDGVFAQMRKAAVLDMLLPLEIRIGRVVKEYAQFQEALLVDCTRKLEQRLGNLRMRTAIELLEQGEVKTWAGLMLEYYDESYRYSNEQREKGSVHTVELNRIEDAENFEKIMNSVCQIPGYGKH